MRVLVLGGTRFVGRAVVDASVAAAHEVTLFNRGQTAPSLYPSLETVIGDRTQDFSALDGRTFDRVIDCAGYLPSVVSLSAAFFADKTDKYVFISSLSVYVSQSAPAVVGDPVLTDDSYGGRKAD